MVIRIPHRKHPRLGLSEVFSWDENYFDPFFAYIPSPSKGRRKDPPAFREIYETCLGLDTEMNTKKEQVITISPHPNLLPEGEGAIASFTTHSEGRVVPRKTISVHPGVSIELSRARIAR